ncbi:hypothetical protein L345_06501, partial [Ophiophagus hannah]
MEALVADERMLDPDSVPPAAQLRSSEDVLDEPLEFQANPFAGPLDLMGVCSSRWAMGFAFGATANKVMILFADGYVPLRVLPQWIKADNGLILLSAAQILGYYEKIIFYWPSLVCQLFLLGKFTHMLIKASWAQFQTGLPTDNTTLLEIHHAQYVQQLLRKPPLQKPQKSWIQQHIYEWDPYFQFPSRMISTMVLAIICLYMVNQRVFAVIEYYVYKLVSCTLVILISNYEMLLVSSNVSDIQPLKEFVEVIEGVWIFTVGSASLTSVSYVFHILACYRKHIKRLRAGQKEFLPMLFSKVSSSQSVGAIARYSGWQIAYLVWGYLVIHIIQCLFGVMLIYGLVLPVKHGQGIEMAKSLGTGMDCYLLAGYKTWIGMLFMDHYHTNPILLCFGHHLAAKYIENQQQRNSYSCHIDQSTDFRVSKKARTRWLLLYTLLKNPCLCAHRKPK